MGWDWRFRQLISLKLQTVHGTLTRFLITEVADIHSSRALLFRNVRLSTILQRLLDIVVEEWECYINLQRQKYQSHISCT